MATQLLNFEGLRFPIWAIANTEAEQSIGESLATHYMTSEDGEKDMPFFTTESKAFDYILFNRLAGHAPATINDKVDFLIRLELFRKWGGTHVRFDDTSGPSDGHHCYELGSLIAHLRSDM